MHAQFPLECNAKSSANSESKSSTLLLLQTILFAASSSFFSLHPNSSRMRTHRTNYHLQTAPTVIIVHIELSDYPPVLIVPPPSHAYFGFQTAWLCWFSPLSFVLCRRLRCRFFLFIVRRRRAPLITHIYLSTYVLAASEIRVSAIRQEASLRCSRNISPENYSGNFHLVLYKSYLKFITSW